MPPRALAAALALAILLPAARAEEPAKPAPLAPFDGERAKALSADAARKPAERAAALVSLLDARLREWAAVAAGTRAADPARDDRGREIALVVSCLVPGLQEEAAAGAHRSGPPALPGGERTVGEALALQPYWDLACLLAGVRPDVPADVAALLGKEEEGTLLVLVLRACEGRCPPGAVAAVLRLLEHPQAVRAADGVVQYPVRRAAARVLRTLGLGVDTLQKSVRTPVPETGENLLVDEEDLAALCRKWLASDVEAEWRGAVAVVRERTTDALVAAASIEMNRKGIPLAKLEALSQLLDEIDARPAGEGR